MRPLALGLILAASPAGATQVDWNGLPFSTNLTSTGQPWDDSWVAELGSFTGAFAPSAANTTAWAAAWRAASRSVYQPGTGYFAGSYSYNTNTAPFLTGTRAHLWLFNPQAPQGEWILLTNPAWTWPAGSAFDPFTTTWASFDATQTVVGQLAAPGWSLKSASVLNSKVPALTFPEWRALYFSQAEISDAGVSGFNADPDRDGASNFIEYGSGSLPRRASSFPSPSEIIFPVANSQTYFGARHHFSTRITGYQWSAQADEGGNEWAHSLIELSNLPWEYSVRWRNPVGIKSGSFQNKGFIRFYFR